MMTVRDETKATKGRRTMNAMNLTLTNGFEVRTLDGLQFDLFSESNRNMATGHVDSTRELDPDLSVDWEWEPELDPAVLREAERLIVAALGGDSAAPFDAPNEIGGYEDFPREHLS
jgi:hypothetical protein